jgi:hypothetical protein
MGMKRFRTRAGMLLMLTLLNGCASEAPAVEPAALAMADAPRVVVDSARPAEAELARFRESLEPPRRLEGGARSLEALVHDFAQAVGTRDTARLRELHITAAEFAWFYYPYTVYTHPPYEQAPGLVWLLTTRNSQKGSNRLLRRFPGRDLRVLAIRCAEAVPQDINTLHGACTVELEGAAAPQRLFGTILEREGRFKFVSYANGL